ncbi:MAG: hypothetical protein ABSA52_00440 [Candidatus Binatia bacterium]|jgi:hypothetical protein
MKRIESAAKRRRWIEWPDSGSFELVTALLSALIFGVPAGAWWYYSPPWAQALTVGFWAAAAAYIVVVPFEHDLENLREGARAEVDNLRAELRAELDGYADRIYDLQKTIGPNPLLPCHPLVPFDLQPVPGVVDELRDYGRRLSDLELTIGRLQGGK